ncbi:MAG: riboflavin synthase [Bacteroidota bacterium]
MFTGIIEAVGRVARIEPLEGGRRFTFKAPFASELKIDQSIAVNGACLTAVVVTDATFEVVAVEETLAKTSLGDLAEGDPVNLERAMRADARLDGHFVLGHVDATGTVRSIETLADSWMVTIAFDRQFAPYLIPVGSVALDGISLTVARLATIEQGGDHLTVAIIPYTWEHTTMYAWQPGRRVNLEFDVLGKYVVRALELRDAAPAGS